MQHVALAVGLAPVRVLGPAAGGALVQADAANTADVFIGGAYVTADATATGGIRLAAGVMLPLAIAGDDPLFAVSSAAGQVLRVITGSDRSLFGQV